MLVAPGELAANLAALIHEWASISISVVETYAASAIAKPYRGLLPDVNWQPKPYLQSVVTAVPSIPAGKDFEGAGSK